MATRALTGRLDLTNIPEMHIYWTLWHNSSAEGLPEGLPGGPINTIHTRQALLQAANPHLCHQPIQKLKMLL